MLEKQISLLTIGPLSVKKKTMNTISSLSVAAILRKTGASQEIITTFANHFANANSHFWKEAFITDSLPKFRRFRNKTGCFATPNEKFAELRPNGWWILDKNGNALRRAICGPDWTPEFVKERLKDGTWIEVF